MVTWMSLVSMSLFIPGHTRNAPLVLPWLHHLPTWTLEHTLHRSMPDDMPTVRP